MDFLIERAVDAVLEASGLKETMGRNERMIRLKQRLGLDDVGSLTAFEDVYAYALVEYAFDDEGQCKPKELIAFFKEKAVREVFRVAFRENDSAVWLRKGQEIAQYRLKDQLPGIEPRRELSTFAAAFIEILKQTRSPKEIRQEQKLDSLQRQIQSVQVQIQQLPSLEAINQTVSLLTGKDTLALPAAARESNAAALAHRLGEWFEVLEYERVPDYEVWKENYFEWAIDVPVTRRRMSRALVRGVAGVVEMSDLQDFAQAIETAGADEGWLVGNRRVSQAARKAAASEVAYEKITCYTFDELLDADADFGKYLDWLEAEIKAKGVDVGYLPLACRKDELDPVSQRKIGVSTYGEEEGWIDGYVDMWLDDPAKEHLSVLGEFGTGKTWFALHYAWVALQKYREAKQRGVERPRIPVVVPLRDYAKSVTVESLFSEFFFRKHEVLKSYSVFEKLNRMGKLLLIFDGFDEMAARVNRQQMIDNFWELAKVVVPGAKAILTCRTEHFPDAIEGRQLLNAELKASVADKTGEPPQFEVLELEKLGDEQISQLIGRKASPATVQHVMGNPQLLDLARRPVMVDLILEALPEIEAGKPVDMARVYLYAVTRKMKNDIKSERTFTSLADKLYFLCELSWEMLSTNQMSLNYRAFPERLQQMFAERVKEEKELDHWRYDMMGQTILIRNSEGDYSPAHRSLLEFFVAYKIVASLGAMAADFTEVAQQQSHLNDALPSQDYTWDSYFKRACDEQGEPAMMAGLRGFEQMALDELLPLLGRSKLAKAVLDLAYPMLAEATMRSQLLPLLQATAQRTPKEVGYLGGNVAQLMLAKTPYALIDADLRGSKLQGVDFTKAFLRRVNLREAQLAEAPFSKVLGTVNSLAYSPDGTHLAIGDSKGILQVWDVATGQVVLFWLGHSASINSVVYSPDGHQVASGSDDQTVKLWNAASGECLRTLSGHENVVRSVVYSPDGHQVASGSDDKTVKLWNAASGEYLRTLSGHEHWVNSVVYSPDGHQVASGSDDKMVKLWNAANGECLRTLSSHENVVNSVVYSPDGHQVASGSDDKMVKLWNAASGECLRTLSGHESGVWSVVYSPDGHQVASGSCDKTMKLWNAASGECLGTLSGHKNGVNSVVYSPSGHQVASGSADQTVKLWNAASGKYLRTLLGHENWVNSVVYSPSGHQVASGSADQMVKLWNAASGKCLRTLLGHENWVMSVVYSPDGHQVASGSDDKTVKLWDAESGECLRTLSGHKHWVNSVVYSPDGHQVASGSADKTVKLWNAANGECLRTLLGHENGVRSVVYSPSGHQVASGSDDQMVKLWNAASGECLRTLLGHENWVRSVVYSPDGHQIASGSCDKTVKLWNAASGECLRTLSGHEDWVQLVVYSPDGHQVVSGSDDGTIRIWDVKTGECLRVIDDRVCAGLDITGTIGLSAGQRTALKLMGAIEQGGEP
jgi:predicted NACHT family NTPase